MTRKATGNSESDICDKKLGMVWIYLSPHFDDVALSCGGLLWEQAQTGEEVQIWTICAGDPPSRELSSVARALHNHWRTGNDTVRGRQHEDLASCKQLSAYPRYFATPDCIYRRSSQDGIPLYPSLESIFGELHKQDIALIGGLHAELASLIPGDARVVCPLGLGNHVDHQIVRIAADTLPTSWYYADYPYVLDCSDQLINLEKQGWQMRDFSISEAGLDAWIDAVAAFDSQINTFWPDRNAMQAAIRAYHTLEGGIRLWKPPN